MTNIRSVEMLFLDQLFEMTGGYVLNFSDRTFTQFFAEELNIDIDNPTYARNGGSKGKRLRCFLQTVDKPAAVRALNALWEYREALRLGSKEAETLENPRDRFLAIINRLQGNLNSNQTKGTEANAAFDDVKIADLRSDCWPFLSLPLNQEALRSKSS